MKKSFVIFFLLSIIIILLGIILYKLVFTNKSNTTDDLSTPNVTVTSFPSKGINRVFSQKGEELQIFQPDSLSEIKSPLVIEGEVRGVWYFEGTFPIRIEDKDGNLIKQGIAQSSEDWMSDDWVGFRASIDFDVENTTDAKIVFERSNPSGLPENEDQATFDITLLESGAESNDNQDKFTTVKIYLKNSNFDPNTEFCEKSYEVTRNVPITQAVAKAAIEELLTGPSKKETDEGFSSFIPTGTKLLSIKVQGDTITADFSKELDQNIGGSCYVGAIRGQIESTLKQFPNIKNVVLCREGMCQQDLILQP
ncbi:GerMN domain-containing protein [Candidatus Dojkabacteria bacterium]|nr:GerMN domain-containing protein [Candidatus Dojkabacteria bacterium]